MRKSSQMKKQHVELTAEDELKLEELLRKGSLKTRVFKRVMSLLELNKGKTYKEVVEIVRLSRTSQTKLVAKYKSEGLNCLYDQARPGRPISITPEQKDKITLLSLEETPEGYSQWSVRLLADKVVELGYCDSISHTQVHHILKKRK